MKKRIIVLILALCLMLSVLLCQSFANDLETDPTDIPLNPVPSTTRQPGDLTGDFFLKFDDLKKMFQHLSGETPLSGPALDYTDVNGDGVTNILDYQALYPEVIK